MIEGPQISSTVSARRVAPPPRFLGPSTAVVFTDIVDSTDLAEKLGDAWPPLLIEHHDIVRRDFEGNGGFEAGNQGDGFLFLFQSVDDAIDAASSTLRTLAQSPLLTDHELTIRIGIHWGKVGFADDVGFFGLALHRGARVMGAANNGQILLSAAAKEAMGAAPHRTSTIDHGAFWLRNLSRPEDLHELVLDGRPGGTPRAPATKLLETPLFGSGLFGRDELLDYIAKTATSGRGTVTTLCGLGGVGKTRLAVETLGRLGGRPTSFLDFSQVETPELVIATIARNVDVDPTTPTVIERIATELETRRMVLALDNLEQVVEVAGDIGRIAALAPDSTIIATSRTALNLANEVVIEIEPLTTESTENLPLPVHEFFAEVAGLASPDDERLAEIREVCRLVDGIPLAVELAAGRVGALGLNEVVSQLAASIGLLSGGRRDMPERHRTLTATMLWSYELTSEAAQLVFRRLSLFPGGVTVEGLGSFGDLDAAQTADALEELADHRLARRHDNRWSMLRVIREVAADELERCHEVDEARRTAARLLRQEARSVGGMLATHRANEAYAESVAQLENFRNLFDWAAEDEQLLDPALATASDLLMFWWHDHLSEGVDTMRRLTDLPTASAARHHASALVAMTVLASYGGSRSEARDLAERAAAVTRESGRVDQNLGAALQQLALSQSAHGQPDLALATTDEMIEVAAQLHPFGRSVLIVGVGSVLLNENLVDQAEQGFSDAIEVFDAAGPSWWSGAAIARLAECELRRGRFSAASNYAVEAVDRWHDGPGINGLPRAWAGLARVRWCQGRLDESHALVKDAAHAAIEMKSYGELPWITIVAGAVASSEGRHDDAWRLFAGSEALGRSFLQPVAGALDHELAPAFEATRAAIGDRRNDVWAIGERASVEELAELVRSA
ncbi:MAG: adenylate/guanylate cyclase domain-containing protein [Actinomycetota bacterium]